MADQPYNLVMRGQRCRGERDGKPITGWCKDPWGVIDAVRRREKRQKEAQPHDL